MELLLPVGMATLKAGSLAEGACRLPRPPDSCRRFPGLAPAGVIAAHELSRIGPARPVFVARPPPVVRQQQVGQAGDDDDQDGDEWGAPHDEAGGGPGAPLRPRWRPH